MKGMGNMAKMMKQVQDMQAKMAKMQEELDSMIFEETAGGGAVKVVVNGKKEVVKIKISPEAVDLEDLEMLEDLIQAAVNKGLTKADETVAEEMKKITGGLSVPGLF